MLSLHDAFPLMRPERSKPLVSACHRLVDTPPAGTHSLGLGPPGARRGMGVWEFNITLNSCTCALFLRVLEKPPACRERDHPQPTPFSGEEMFCNKSLPDPPGIVRGGVHAGGLKFD